jgi:hypothetical protein
MALSIDGKCPCLDPNALPKQIQVDGHGIAIVGLTEMVNKVRKLGLADDKKIKKELLERVKKHNWVPESAEDKYADALFEEYKRQAPHFSAGVKDGDKK